MWGQEVRLSVPSFYYFKVRVQSLFPKNGCQQDSKVVRSSDSDTLDHIMAIVLLQLGDVVNGLHSNSLTAEILKELRDIRPKVTGTKIGYHSPITCWIVHK